MKIVINWHCNCKADCSERYAAVCLEQHRIGDKFDNYCTLVNTDDQLSLEEFHELLKDHKQMWHEND